MVSSHSSIEIYAAMQAGKTVIISEQGTVYTVSEISEDKISIFIELTGFEILFYDIDINKTVILKNTITMAAIPYSGSTTNGNILSVVDEKPTWTKSTGGIAIQAKAPENTNILWLDTDDDSATPDGSVELDATLTQSGQAADAKAVGDAMELKVDKHDFNELIDNVENKSQVKIVTQDVSEFLPTLSIHKLTQEEYNQKLVDGTVDENALYLTPDEEIDLSIYATIEQLNTKANFEHNHDISNIVNLQSSLDELFKNSKVYADSAAVKVKNDLLNGAGEAYDTLKELSELIDDNTNTIKALENVAIDKADKEHIHNISDIINLQYELDEKVAKIDLDTHIDNNNIHITSAERAAWNAIEKKSQTYTDNAISQKNCVQIVTWEDDD